MRLPGSDRPAAPTPGDLAAALEGYVAAGRPSRRYSVGDTALVLLVTCLVALTLDSEGLVAWARRLDVSRTQATLTRTLTALHAGLSSLGVAKPRRWADDAKDLALHALGAGGDSLLAEGWVPANATPVVPPPAVVPEPPQEVLPEPRAVVPEPAPVEEAVVEPVVEPVVTPTSTGGVLLLGDSMMVGSLGSTLERTLSRKTGLPITRAAQLGTGLARPDVYDWMKVVPSLLERDQPRFVVVALGANDATALLEGDEQIDYGTARWRQVYAARVEAMMRALAGTRARVLWLTLPPMRDRKLTSRGASLNGVFASGARRVRRVELLELDVLVTGADGEYATFVQGVDGKLARYRLDDGVHLAPAGARVVASWIADWVRERR